MNDLHHTTFNSFIPAGKNSLAVHYLKVKHRWSFIKAAIQSQVPLRLGHLQLAESPQLHSFPSSSLVFRTNIPVCQSISLSICVTLEVKNCPRCTKAAAPCLIDVGISLRVYVSSLSVFYIYIYLFFYFLGCVYL